MGELIALLINLLAFAILGRALISWFQLPPDNPIVVILYQITEPILAPLRRVVPRLGMFDITPMIAMFVLFTLAGFVSRANF